MEAFGSISGLVLGPDSEPWPGTRVTLEPSPRTANRPELAVHVAGSVPTDARGRFAIEDLEPGDYLLSAIAPGFEATQRDLYLSPGEALELPAIFLVFGVELSGVVVDAETNEPLVGVDVRAIDPPGAADTVSGLQGEFRVFTGADRSLTLRFETPDYVTRDVEVSPKQIEAGDPIRVELHPAGWILVVADDPDTGFPCQGCRVSIDPSRTELTTDSLGEVLSGPLAPGFYKVGEPLLTHLGSTVVEQPEAHYRWARVSPGEVSIVRIGRQGRQIRVRFDPTPRGLWTLSARTAVRAEKHYPGDDGAYVVELRPHESLDLFLQRYDPDTGLEIEVRQGTVPADAEDDVVLPLQPTAIRGMALGEAGPVGGQPVQLRSLLDGSLQATVATRDDGHFEIPHPLPGLYSLTIGGQSVKFVRVSEHETVDLGTFQLPSLAFQGPGRRR